MNLSRRDFLKTATIGATAAMTLKDWQAARGQLPFSRVVEMQAENVQREDLLDGAILREMVEQGIRELTGKRTTDTGWKSLVAANDVVAIRVSATLPELSTHHALVDEVIRGLVIAGVPPENVIIWDRFAERLERYAYQLKPLSEFGFAEPRGKILASEGAAGKIERVGYEETVYFESDEDLAVRRGKEGTFSYYSKIVARMATKIISLPVLKVHPITGFSGALASLALGAVNNTFRFHSRSKDGMPMIADLWTARPLNDKHTLTIVDALSAAYHHGPGYDPKWFWKANRLYFSNDPVALDTILLKALNAKRDEATPRLPQISRTNYIARAASFTIGTNDSSELEHVQKTIA